MLSGQVMRKRNDKPCRGTSKRSQR
jgi:hypothetical protein